MVKLNLRQRKFIEVYCGNATEAARLAGYTGDDNTLGVTAFELLRNPKIAEAIQKRESKEIKSLVATRKERQEFWSKIMKSEKEHMLSRLRASELLGKSEADFTSKVEHSGNVGLETLSDEQLDRRLKELRESEKK